MAPSSQELEPPENPGRFKLLRLTFDSRAPLPLVVTGEDLCEFEPDAHAERLRLLWKPYTVERLLRCIDSIDFGYAEDGRAVVPKP